MLVLKKKPLSHLRVSKPEENADVIPFGGETISAAGRSSRATRKNTTRTSCPAEGSRRRAATSSAAGAGGGASGGREQQHRCSSVS